MISPFRLEALADAHDRSSFRCGVEALDRYFREQPTRDIRRRVSNCFVAVERVTGDIAGYYKLATSGIEHTDLPTHVTKRLPRYRMIPAVQVGRLAVDLRYRGRRMGSGLLADAAARSARSDPAAFTLVVDAKDEDAAAFYRKNGFTPLQSRPLTLFLPIATALKLLS